MKAIYPLFEAVMNSIHAIEEKVDLNSLRPATVDEMTGR